MYWNIGDTSFRRKQIIEEYTELASILLKLNDQENFRWDNSMQEHFYNLVPTELKREKLGAKILDSDQKAKRARTYTNAISKLGFCNDKRIVSPIGKLIIDNLEDNVPIIRDDFEKMLDISDVSLIILRQLQKYSYDGFYVFYYIQKLLINNSISPEEIHLLILMTNKEKYEILEDYFSGQSKKSYLEIVELLANDFTDKQVSFLTSEYINDELIYETFPNRKSKKFIESDIIPLVYLVENFAISKTKDNYENLAKFIKSNDKFKINNEIKIKNITFENFEDFDHPIFSADMYIRRNTLLYLIKNKQIIQNAKDYSDILKRVINLTGVISSKNGLSVKNDVFKKFIEIAPIPNGKIDFYDTNTFDSIYKIKICEKINLDFGIDITNLRDEYKRIENFEFSKFINTNYPIDKTIKILGLFSDHIKNGEEISRMTTPNAKIPTIYEYMLGIAWYHISEHKFNLYEAYNLSLGTDYLPISHAPGGAGDIEITYWDDKSYGNHKLLLEATLLRGQTQDRNELEPVIRHSANLVVNSEQAVHTLFIAEEVSKNMRTMLKVGFPYTTSSSKEVINIVECLETKSLIKMLQNNVKYGTIYPYIENKNLNTLYK